MTKDNRRFLFGFFFSKNTLFRNFVENIAFLHALSNNSPIFAVSKP